MNYVKHTFNGNNYLNNYHTYTLKNALVPGILFLNFCLKEI